jgi:hypothetical protein
MAKNILCQKRNHVTFKPTPGTGETSRKRGSDDPLFFLTTSLDNSIFEIISILEGLKGYRLRAFENNPLLERRKDHAHPQSRKLAF